MNKPNFFLGNSVIVLASLVIFISALLIPSNPNFEGFTLTNPQLIEKFPSSVSQSEVHEAGNKVGLTDFISALNSKNKITGMPAGSPGSCADITDFVSECVNYAAYVTPGKSPAPTRMEYATYAWGVAPPPGDHAAIPLLDPPLNSGDPGDSAWNDGIFCYWKWDASGVTVRDECNSNTLGDPGHPYIVGDYFGGGGGGGNNPPTWAQVITHPTINEDASATSVDSDMTSSGNGQCTDADGDTLTFSVTSENTAQVDCAVSGNALTVTPASNWFGTASCTIRCDDGNGGTADDVVSITVNSVNDAPVLAGIPDQTLNHNATMNNIIDLYSYHSDVDGSDAATTFSILSESQTSVVDCSIDSDRYIDCTYGNLPGSSVNYSDVDVVATDASSSTNIDTFRITITNTQPTITTPSISPSSPTDSDSLTSSSSTSDSDGDTVTTIYDWRVGGTSIALLNLPFESYSASGIHEDYSSYGHDFTGLFVGGGGSATTVDCGLSGRCIELSGSNEFIFDADDSDFDSLTALSVCAWVHPDSWGGSTTTDYIFDKRHGSSPWRSFAFFFHQSGDKLRLALADSGSNTDSLDYDYPSGAFPTGSWQFVCGTWDGSQSTTTKLYYNGALVASETDTIGTTLLNGNGGQYIGALGDGFQHFFDGYMDNVQVYNRALSANQISEMYNSGTPDYNVIHSDETSVGNTWTVVATPNDGIEDGSSGTSSGVTVGSSNSLPTSSNSEVTTNEDTEFTFSGSDFPFTDSDGDSLNKIKITSLESAGDLELSNSDVTLNQEIAAASISSLTFDPVANANGANYSQFQFKVHDGTDYSTSAYYMSINVTAVNDAPTISGTTVNVYGTEDTAYVFGTSNFTTSVSYNDVDGDAFAGIKITSATVNGDLYNGATKLTGVGTQCDRSKIVLGLCTPYNIVVSAADIAAGNFKYVPDADITGSPAAAYGFLVGDGTTYSSGVGTSYNIHISGVNDAPVWTSVISDANINEEATATFDSDLTSGTGRCTDVDGDSLTFTINSENTNEVDCSISSNAVSGTGATDFSGSASCTVRCSDGSLVVDDTFTITVNNVNDAPTTPSGSSLAPSTLLVGNTLTATGAGSTDADGDSITYYYEFRRSSASGTILQAYSTDNTYVVVQADAHDTIYVNIKAYDGTAYSSEETESKAVSNTAPSVTGESYSLNSGNTLTKSAGTGVLANENDADGDSLTASITASPSGSSSFTFNADGSFTYVSDPTYTGSSDTFTYSVSDGNGGSNSGTTTINLAKTISMSLSNSLSTAFTFSASAANAEVATTGEYHVNLTANGTRANLSIKASGDLSDGSNSIALSNFKYNRTGNSNKVSLTTSETNLTESSAGQLNRTFFDFFINVPSSSSAGTYTTTVTFRGETLL